MAAYEQTDDCLIYDFETLSQNPYNGVAVSLAILNFNRGRFVHNPYEYEELIDKVATIKFDVNDQVKNYNRKIENDTLEWWKNQSEEAQKQLRPSSEDVSISELYNFMILNTNTINLRRVYTRNNTFDPMFLYSLCLATGKPLPYDWWLIRDTKSMIDGLSHGMDLKDDFIPEGLSEKFVAHDPKHDVAMDVMRLQTLIRGVEGLE
jgi:hypothetical protein